MAEALEGADKLLAQLRAIGKVRVGLKDAAKAAIAIAAEEAAALVPVGSRMHRTYKGHKVHPGFLKRNIRTIVSVKGGIARASLGVRKEAFYGVQFVERSLGKSSQRGRAFIAPAFRNTKEEMLRAVVASIQQTIDSAAGSR